MNYYILEPDFRIEGAAGVGGVPDDLDPLDWIQGKKMSAPSSPALVTLSTSSGPVRPDLMGNLLTMTSAKMRDALTKFGVDNIDYYPVRLQHPYGESVEPGYWLANVLGLLRCVDTSRSIFTPRPSGGKEVLGPFHVDHSQTYGLPLFRIYENPTLIIIHEGLMQHLTRSRLVGVRMRPTAEYGP